MVKPFWGFITLFRVLQCLQAYAGSTGHYKGFSVQAIRLFKAFIRGSGLQAEWDPRLEGFFSWVVGSLVRNLAASASQEHGYFKVRIGD